MPAAPAKDRDFGGFEPIQRVTDTLTKYIETSARANGLIDAKEDAWYFGNKGARITGYENSGDAEQILTASRKIAEQPMESRKRVAEFLGASTIVSNALDYFHYSNATKSPQERCEEFIRQGVEKGGEGFISALRAVAGEDSETPALFRVITTIHPTVYEAKFAREREADLTQKLEAISDHLKANNTIDPQDPLIAAAKASIDTLIKGMVAGEEITFNKKVTVAEENIFDRANHNAMKENFEETRKAFNAAVQAVAGELESTDPQTAAKLRPVAIKHEQFDARAWGNAADKDGRPESSAEAFWGGLTRLEDRGGSTFLSRTRDVRDNSQAHEDALSCVLQTASSAFYDPEEHLKGRIKQALKPGQKVLQDMGEDAKGELLKDLLKDDSYLSTAFREDLQTIKKGTIEFNEKFKVIFRDYLHENNLPETTSLQNLQDMDTADKNNPGIPRNRLQELSGKIKKETMTYDADGKAESWWDLDTKNLTYEKSPPLRHTKLLAGTQIKETVVAPLSTVQMISLLKQAQESGEDVEALAAQAKRTQTSSHLRDLKGDEEKQLLDVVKYMQILDHAIGEKFGNAVADRYQIAEFGSANDFYTALLLFKETGIISVKDGKVERKEALVNGVPTVISPKLTIQPLLETIDDQKRAVEIFEKLLDDKLVRSYYEALGNKAEMMVGYSDGSKSAGNFASEWSIYKTQRDLHEVFKKKGIELNFFHGRGNGSDRGGQAEPGQNLRMQHPVLQDRKVLDETQQSDLPLAEATSRKLGKDHWVSRLEGMVTSTYEGRKALENPEEYKKYDAKLDAIAKISEEKFKTLVHDSEESLALLGTVPDNPYKSSRPSSRSANPEFDKIRAIAVEHGFNMAGAPLHNIGLKSALEAQDPNTLQDMYEHNDFFRGMMDKTAQGLADYNPEVFRMHAKVAGVSEWAEKCIEELDGMRDLVQKVRGQEPQLPDKERMQNILNSGSNRPWVDRSADLVELTPERLAQQDLLANANALTFAAAIGADGNLVQATPDHNPLKPPNGVEGEISRLLLLPKSSPVGHRMLHPAATVRRAVEGAGIGM